MKGGIKGMKKFKISVVVPVYNSEKYIKECVDSLVNQTISFSEIVLVDDGSNDSSLEICYEYQEKYNNIIVISKSNGGPGSARNVGLGKVSADYVIFVDSDDYVDTHLCESLSNKLRNSNVDILLYNASSFHEISYSESKDAYVHINEVDTETISGIEYMKLSFPRRYSVSSWLAAYRMEYLQEYNLKFMSDVLLCEDNVFYLHTMTNASRVIGINDFLYNRRYRENSIMTSKLSLKKELDIVKIINEIMEYVSNIIIEQQDVFWLRYIIKEFALLYKRLLEIDLPELQKERILLCDKFKKLFADKLKQIDFLWEVQIVKLITRCNPDYSIIQKKYSQIINDKCKKIAFYGIGNNTNAYIELYRIFVGEIKSQIVFILSNKQINEYLGYEVISCEEVSDDIDAIIITSYTYQDEMKNNLIKNNVNENKIFLAHDKDLFDSYIARELLGKR